MNTEQETPEDHRKVAIVGASRNRRKYGNKAVRAFRQAGWVVYPVNPHAERIEGLETFRSLADLPTAVDRISVYLHPEDTLKLLPEIQETGCEDNWLNPGSADMRTLEICHEMGLPAVNACSIVEIGLSPADFS